MSYLNQNLKYLRKQRGYTQDVLAKKTGVKRSLIGAYEEHRAEPKVATIQRFAHLFSVSIDHLINTDLNIDSSNHRADVSGKSLRILPITVDAENNERISVVPEKAEAGYAQNYADPEYIEELPRFSLPINELYQDQTYRLFQISGDSMLPIPSGSYIISSYIPDWHEIKDGQCCIVVTRDQGIVYKRLWNQLDEGSLLLKSDNRLYEPYSIPVEEVVEIWLASGYIAFDLPNREYTPLDPAHFDNALSGLKEDVGAIKQILLDKKHDA